MTASCIRIAAREIVRVLRGNFGGNQGNWWWNRGIQGKMKAKNVIYVKSVESKNDEEKLTNRERYKMMRKEAKLALRR